MSYDAAEDIGPNSSAPGGPHSSLSSTLMGQEILQQPDAIAQTLRALSELEPEMARLVRNCRQVVLFGRGTSGNAARYGRQLLTAYAAMPAYLGSPSLASLYHPSIDMAGSLVVLISQSGATAEIAEVLAWARGAGARTLAITNERTSELAGAADLACVTEAGVEQAVPATKTFTTALVSLAMLGLVLRPPAGELRDNWAELPELAEQSLSLSRDHAPDAAAQIESVTTLLVTGRGYTTPIAYETALKVSEATREVALGLSQGDLEHGPITVLGPDSALVVVASPSGPTLPGLRAVTTTALSRGARVVVIGGDKDLAGRGCCALGLPPVAEELAAVLASIPGQALAAELAVAKGKSPDAPLGLTKVTQTSGPGDRGLSR